MTKSTFDRVVELLNHKRAEITWLCRPGVRDDGQPCIVRMARIVAVYPIDGAGRLRVAVTDWGESGNGDPVHFYATASGCGYDKLTAAIDGCTLGGIKVGDHCNRDGFPTWKNVPRVKEAEGWEFIGAL